MTDSFTVYQKSVSMKFTNPYNYPIEVQIRVQKLLGGEERYSLYTNLVHFDVSRKDYLDWETGLQATYPSPETVSNPRGGEAVGIVTPTFIDTNSVLSGPCERTRKVYEDSDVLYGVENYPVSSGWSSDFLWSIIYGSESVQAKYIDTLRNSAYVVSEIDIELEPGEEYVLEKDCAPLWTGSVNYNPFYGRTQSGPFYGGEYLPGWERTNLASALLENKVQYEVTYCWRPKPEEEPEEESE